MCKESIVFSNKPESVDLEAGRMYAFCTCGRAEDGLFCDGSHKGTACKPLKSSVDKSGVYHLCRCKSSKNFPFCDGTHSRYSDDEVGGPVKGE